MPAGHGARSHEATPADADERLDRVLARVLNCSAGEARRLLDAGAVRVRGRVAGLADKGRRVAAGDTIEVAADTDRIEPVDDRAIRTIAEGEGWLIVDKPAGMPVHPLRSGEVGTVFNAVAARHPAVQGVGEGGLRSGVVHRLDVETSGALAAAYTDDAWRWWREAFEARRVEKRYLALVAGRLERGAEEVQHLAVARHRPATVRVVDPSHRGARRCDLVWRSLAASAAASLVEVTLGTGFLHQVRVMFAHLGHPLIGDAHYDGPTVLDDERAHVAIDRPMLHAARLRLDQIDASCSPPEDFVTLRRALDLDRNLDH